MIHAPTQDDTQDELALEENFVEQAEYIDTEHFIELSADHPQEEAILKRLTGGGAKLLIGPRGSGKSTLMLKAYYKMLQQRPMQSLPVYVNFKLALKLEPLYVRGPNASYWFRKWIILKIVEASITSFRANEGFLLPDSMPSKDVVSKLIDQLERGEIDIAGLERYDTAFLSSLLETAALENALGRCVLLIDDAAHAFSEKQQEDFFDFFRAIKSKIISPKAAVYPGVTAHSPSFHVGHDAEQIDVWMKPSGSAYEEFMMTLARKRLTGPLLDAIERNQDDLKFLAYAAFGIPRAFLGMLRTIYNAQDSHITSDGQLNRRKILELSRYGRDMSHAVYHSLESKLPSYKSYVSNGSKIYQAILASIKAFNSDKDLSQQALQIGLGSPVGPDLEKVVGFLQYAGLLMPAGDVMRGVKGTFAIYDVHLGDLVAENTIVGRRTKSVTSFLEVMRATKHQAWPRLQPSNILHAARLTSDSFSLSLPQCHACGAERSSPDARFCTNCGAQLKASSTYESLVQQDISVLPLTKTMSARIKENSQIRRVRDILIDTSREQLRSIPYIGEIRAKKIVGLAEEYVS